MAESCVHLLHALLEYTGSGTLRLIGARHACLEVQDDVNFIANDAVMVKGTARVIFIAFWRLAAIRYCW